MDLNKHFGDAYDVVKRSVLAWLATVGPWSAHPMFTHDVAQDQVSGFSNLLGVPIISSERLSNGIDRTAYLSACDRCTGHVFLDPDTGLKLGRGHSPSYLFGDELARLVEARPTFLTMTFDQRLQRGNELNQAQAKLDYFAALGVSGVAYVAQVAFLLFSKDADLVDKARRAVLDQSALPEHRLLLARRLNPR